MVCDYVFPSSALFLFFFNDTATTEIYTLSLHDALPISGATASLATVASNTPAASPRQPACAAATARPSRDRKSTRLNSSHSQISYAVFCLKKKKSRYSIHICEFQSVPVVHFPHLLH